MLALYRIHRPSTFAEVTGQEHVTTTLQNQIKFGSVCHAYVFTGPRGVGKTTIARLLAKAMNCERINESEPCNTCEACKSITEGRAIDVFEIDAASHTDVDHVRENIIRNVPFAPITLKKKVYIIDEVHMLSTSAFNALLKTLEEPPAHVLFILATTEIHKVPATILSRCQRFDFKRISKEDIKERLQKILVKESRRVSGDVLMEIARHSGGSERDAESLLGQILALGDDQNEITMNEASLVLPATTIVLVTDFLQALFSRDATKTIRLLNANLEHGIDLTHFLEDVISTMRDQLLVEVAKGSGSDQALFLNRAIALFLTARRHIRTDEIPQLPAELVIVELCFESLSKAECGKAAGPIICHPEAKAEGSLINFNQPGVDLSQVVNTHVILQPVIETATTLPVAEFISEPYFEEKIIDQIVAEEKVFDSIPVISVDEVKRVWPEVFAQVQACNASLPLFLQACEVNHASGDLVELTFEYDLYVQTINKEKNRKLVESILERVLGRAVRIKAVLTKSKEPDENVSSLLDAFGGSVV